VQGKKKENEKESGRIRHTERGRGTAITGVKDMNAKPSKMTGGGKNQLGQPKEGIPRKVKPPRNDCRWSKEIEGGLLKKLGVASLKRAGTQRGSGTRREGAGGEKTRKGRGGKPSINQG